MTTIYLKSADEHSVVSIRASGGRTPQIPDYLADEGYQVIDPKEFRRLKAKIERRALRPDHALNTRKWSSI